MAEWWKFRSWSVSALLSCETSLVFCAVTECTCWHLCQPCRFTSRAIARMRGKKLKRTLKMQFFVRKLGRVFQEMKLLTAANIDRVG